MLLKAFTMICSGDQGQLAASAMSTISLILLMKVLNGDIALNSFENVFSASLSSRVVLKYVHLTSRRRK